MKKFLIIILFLINSCGYQPMYVKQNTQNFEFTEIETYGNKNINRKIISLSPINQVDSKNNVKKLILNSSKNIEITSKNSKGQITSYRTKIAINLKIMKDDQIFKQKDFTEDFSYNNMDNKFDLSEYQRKIEQDLINNIVEKLFFYLNI